MTYYPWQFLVSLSNIVWMEERGPLICLPLFSWYFFMDAREVLSLLKYLWSYGGLVDPFASIWRIKFANWPSWSISQCLDSSTVVVQNDQKEEVPSSHLSTNLQCNSILAWVNSNSVCAKYSKMDVNAFLSQIHSILRMLAWGKDLLRWKWKLCSKGNSGL